MRRWERVVLVAAMLVAGLVAANVAVVAMAGFLYFLDPEGEAETDWSTQPIEVVVTEAERTCTFNVEAVAPGRHDVDVIPNDADAVVVIRDPSGGVVLRHAEEADGTIDTVPAVRLRLGTYDVECRTDTATMTAELPVVPANELG